MKPILKSLNPIQLVGFTISLGVPLTLLIAGQETIQTIILGFVLAALTELLSLEVKLGDTQRRVLQANALSQALYEEPWLLERIQSIVRDYLELRNVWFEVFTERAKHALVECYTVLRGMSGGRLDFGKRDPFSYGRVGMRLATTSLKGTTTTQGQYGGFWRTPAGDKYLQENRAAVARRVKYTRVFMCSGSLSERDIEVMKTHRSQGIEVFVVRTEDIAPEATESIVIMDDRLVSRTHLGQTGHVTHWTMSIDPDEVKRMVTRFEDIMHKARSLDAVLNEPPAGQG